MVNCPLFFYEVSEHNECPHMSPSYRGIFSPVLNSVEIVQCCCFRGDDPPNGSKSGQPLTGTGFGAQLRAPAMNE